MRLLVIVGGVFVCLLEAVAGQTTSRNSAGSPRGTVILASVQTRPILARFLELAGGADSKIVFVPTGHLQKPGAPQMFLGTNAGEAALKAAGAKEIVVLHTFDRAIADLDSFVEPLRRAGGVWLGGGLPENLLDTYAGTKVEQELRGVLARGGVVGGLSAGAMVLAGQTVNGSLGSDRQWVVRQGFGLLRGIAFQPHAQNPKPESWMLNRPDLLCIAADNSTAWVVRGDVAEIIGEGRAYVYTTSAGNADTAFITFQPGDRYELATGIVHSAQPEAAVKK